MDPLQTLHGFAIPAFSQPKRISSFPQPSRSPRAAPLRTKEVCSLQPVCLLLPSISWLRAAQASGVQPWTARKQLNAHQLINVVSNAHSPFHNLSPPRQANYLPICLIYLRQPRPTLQHYPVPTLALFKLSLKAHPPPCFCFHIIARQTMLPAKTVSSWKLCSIKGVLHN